MIVNRGYLYVTPKQKFVDWSNELEDFKITLEMVEANVYLIEEEFFEDELVIKANFKAIMKNEFTAVTEDAEEWPCEIKLETFNEYFEIKAGSTVVDLQSNNLKKD
ncbi:MAG: hypothetical protein ACI9G9_001001 [Psychromonas sp.]|jgi:hypothetical protein